MCELNRDQEFNSSLPSSGSTGMMAYDEWNNEISSQKPKTFPEHLEVGSPSSFQSLPATSEIHIQDDDDELDDINIIM